MKIWMTAAFAFCISTAPSFAQEAENPNIRVIKAYYAAYGSGDMNKVAQFFADDVVWHIPGHHPLAGTKHGAKEVLAFFKELGKSGFKAEVVTLMANDEYVIDVHRGWSNRKDAPNVDTTWVLVYKVVGGKIKEARNFSFDQHSADQFFWGAYPMKPLPQRLAD
jgi:ketosteroid isomerase-like protein